MTNLRKSTGAILVPADVLFALSKRRLTTSEIMVVAAICTQFERMPGRAKTTVAVLARTMGVRKDTAAKLIRHAIKKCILTAAFTGDGSAARLLSVNSPDKWKVPG